MPSEGHVTAGRTLLGWKRGQSVTAGEFLARLGNARRPNSAEICHPGERRRNLDNRQPFFGAGAVPGCTGTGELAGNPEGRGDARSCPQNTRSGRVMGTEMAFGDNLQVQPCPQGAGGGHPGQRWLRVAEFLPILAPSRFGTERGRARAPPSSLLRGQGGCPVRNTTTKSSPSFPCPRGESGVGSQLLPLPVRLSSWRGLCKLQLFGGK